MKICILTSRFPFPQYSGGILRINEVCKYLKSKGHTLILVSLSDVSNPPINDAQELYDKVYYVKRGILTTLFNCLISFFKGRPLQCGYYNSNKYRKLLCKVIEEEQPDLYIPHLLRMVPYLEELGLEKSTVVEMTDALSKTYTLSSQARGGGILKYIYRIEQSLIKKYEEAVINKFKKVVLVSHADIDYLKKLNVKNDSLHVYTNGTSIINDVPNSYDKNKLCFIGSMGFLPNQDAIHFFMESIFPLVKKEMPSMTFHIVGSRPTEEMIRLGEQNKDIVVTGFVDDLNKYISDACVTVAPIRVAAGIQNKVLVSMGCGVPVVLTSLISKSIPELRNNDNCFIADNPNEIAGAIIKVMKSKKLRNDMGLKGYNLVKNNYNWNACLDGYENLNFNRNT